MTNELWYPASPSPCLTLFNSRSIDYWNTLPFVTPPPLIRLLFIRPSAGLAPPLAILYLVPFIWLIWYLELIGLWIEARVFTHICFNLPISHFCLPASLFFSPPKSLGNEIRLQPFICISNVCRSERDSDLLNICITGMPALLLPADAYSWKVGWSVLRSWNGDAPLPLIWKEINGSFCAGS